MPTQEEKAAFQEAAQPVYEWFTPNVDGGEAALEALRSAVTEVQGELDTDYEAELN